MKKILASLLVLASALSLDWVNRIAQPVPNVLAKSELAHDAAPTRVAPTSSYPTRSVGLPAETVESTQAIIRSYARSKRIVLPTPEDRRARDASFTHIETFMNVVQFVAAPLASDLKTDSPALKDQLSAIDWLRASFARHLKGSRPENFEQRAEILARSLTSTWYPAETGFDLGVRATAGAQMEAFAILAEVDPARAQKVLEVAAHDARLSRLYLYASTTSLHSEPSKGNL